MVLRRHRRLVEELLPHDVVELILECVPVEPLLRFRSVSKRWKSTIDSQRFMERQLIRRRQLRAPDVLFIRLDCDQRREEEEDRTLAFGTSLAWTVRFPILPTIFCHGNCDGLVCLFDINIPSYVVNPATGLDRPFRLSNFQQLLITKLKREGWTFPYHKLGFGRDKVTGTFKPIWLHNSSLFGLDNVTTCEVFDFTTDSWRYLVPASPYPIIAYHKPVYLDGSLYWFTECQEPKVLSFDLHTETFQVLCKTPFALPCHPRHITMCILDNRLCVSEEERLVQVIWSFDFSAKTWKTLCSFDLTPTFPWFGDRFFTLLPIAFVDKGKLLLQGRDSYEPVVIYDLHTKSFDFLFRPKRPLATVYYFQSLFSDLSN